MYDSIKVVLDVSILGSGYRYAQKAGIFRYTSNLVSQLMNTEGIHLSLCAGESLELLHWTKRFLEVESQFKSCSFMMHRRLEHTMNETVNYIDFIEKCSHFLHQRGITRTKKIKELLITLKTPKEGITGLDCLTYSGIYHSPYYSIPNELKNSKLRSFITIHDLIPLIKPDFFIKSVRENFSEIINSLDQETWIICVSESTKQDLLHYRSDLDPEKIFVVHLAASEEFHSHASESCIQKVKHKYGISADRPYLLSLSTLEIRKNIPHLIRAFIRLISQEPIDDLCLVLAGRKGWLGHEINYEIQRLNDRCKDRIIFTGYVEDGDLAPLYKGAIAFVYPSLYEGFGLPPLEAMRCGTPVITSNTSSLPEVVGKAGILIDPLDQDTLCQSMLDVYSDGSLRTDMAIRSIEQSAQFSWENCAQHTFSAYKKSLLN